MFVCAQLLLDERDKEGAALRKWFDLLYSKHPASIPADTILEFIEKFIAGFRAE